MQMERLEIANIDEVRRLERMRIEATRMNDAAALDPLLDESLVYINSIGQVYDKSGYLRAIQSHGLTYDDDFDVRETEYRAWDDLVILVGLMLGHCRLEGEQQVFRFASLGVWRRQGRAWRLIAWQSSSSSEGF